MMFITRPKIGKWTQFKGLFTALIPYENRVPSGNWQDYFGHYQNQRWGEWDSDSCWALSMINCVEDQLEWLNKNGKFSPEALTFFTTNGYIDSDGDFSLSERFIEILGGLKIAGGTAPYAWQLLQKYGAIPRTMLTYSLAQAQACPTQDVFVADYFNTGAITQQMKDLGQKFLQYVNIEFQQIGSLWTTPDLVTLQTSLKQAPLQIGIPIPADVSKWNNQFVDWDGGRVPQHEVELYGINPDGSYNIFDQYLPNLKALSKNYALLAVHQGVVTAIQEPISNPKDNVAWDLIKQILAFAADILHLDLQILKKP